MHTDDDLPGLYANVIAPQRQRFGQPQSAVVHEVGNQDIAKVCRPAQVSRPPAETLGHQQIEVFLLKRLGSRLPLHRHCP